MKNNVLILIFSIILLNLSAFAQNPPLRPHDNFAPPRFDHQRQKQFDSMLETRLNLTDSQKQYINTQRPIHRREMEQTLDKMHDIHSKIKDAYSTQPKYQADITTAPMKAELAILKQNADKQKAQGRRDFENILDKNQRNEFEKIKKEFAKQNRGF